MHSIGRPCVVPVGDGGSWSAACAVAPARSAAAASLAAAAGSAAALADKPLEAPAGAVALAAAPLAAAAGIEAALAAAPLAAPAEAVALAAVPLAAPAGSAAELAAAPFAARAVGVAIGVCCHCSGCGWLSLEGLVLFCIAADFSSFARGHWNTEEAPFSATARSWASESGHALHARNSKTGCPWHVLGTGASSVHNMVRIQHYERTEHVASLLSVSQSGMATSR